ncbi:MAG: patatin-like phospholipase family protein [Spirochaetaceae bacterium]
MAKRIGIAFGGGGARGLAHVGVMKALEPHPELRPTLFAGSSAGSIAGALFAAGLSLSEIERATGEMEWFRDVIRLSDTVRHIFEGFQGGLVSNEKLGETLNDLLGHRTFDQLPYDLAVVTSDLESRARVVFTSKRVVARLDRKPLTDFLPPPDYAKPGVQTVIVSDVVDVGLAVRASCAVPGVFVPVKIAGMHLVDGGVFDQVPVDVVKGMGADLTIGVSLGLGYQGRQSGSAIQVLGATISYLGLHQIRRSLDMADLGFQVSGIDSRSPVREGQRDLIAIGEKDMQERIPLLRQRVRGPWAALY